MILNTVDLYAHFGLEKPAHGKGILTCLIQEPASEFCPNRKYPAMLVIPGGGYSMVSQREALPVAYHFLTKGYSAFVLDYAVAPAMFPTALREAAMAMRYIRQLPHIRTNLVAAMGFSAGGHLCGTLSTMYDCPELEGFASAGQARPDASALCYPVLVGWGPTHDGTFQNISGGDEALRMRLSLEKQVRPDMPPVFLWHTRDDAAVPVRNSLIMANALEEAGISFAMHIYRTGRHGLSLADETVYRKDIMPDVISPDVSHWMPALLSWLKEEGFEPEDRA